MQSLRQYEYVEEKELARERNLKKSSSYAKLSRRSLLEKKLKNWMLSLCQAQSIEEKQLARKGTKKTNALITPRYVRWWERGCQRKNMKKNAILMPRANSRTDDQAKAFQPSADVPIQIQYWWKVTNVEKAIDDTVKYILKTLHWA